jgi:hypothetical protein
MVIANSDSNTTLVSLNQFEENHKYGILEENIVVGETGLLQFADPSRSERARSNSQFASDGGLPTNLLLATTNTTTSSLEEHVPLYLPAQKCLSLPASQHLDVDEYLTRNYYSSSKTLSTLETGAKVLQTSRDQLLFSKRRRVFGGKEEQKERLLYVAQGERANATSSEYDVLMSDKATTCHILAFRSMVHNNDSENTLPLTSLTHLDGAQYEECVRDMIQEHIDFHQQRSSDGNKRRKTKLGEEEKKCNDCNDEGPVDYEVIACKRRHCDEKITIDIHVMGGFNDDDGSSSTITNWLLRLLSQLADEFKDQCIGLEMVIKTLVVSSSNNQVEDKSKINSPIGRGLGINVRTGEVFLAQCKDVDQSSHGPAPVLRSVRLWSRGGSSDRCSATRHLQPEKLSVVHTVGDSDKIWKSLNVDTNDRVRKEYSLFWVRPFQLRSIPDIDVLLGLPNQTLLQYTSTSPEAEEPDFCKDVRASLHFLKDQCEIKRDDGRSLFGKTFDEPLVFALHHGEARTSMNDPKESIKQQRGQWKQLSL